MDEQKEEEYKEITLTPRQLPLEVFKAIRFRNKYPSKFTGHLLYLRKYHKNYNVVTGDMLDDLLLKAITNRFGNAKMIYSEQLLFNEQLKDCLIWTRGGETKDIIFYFLPQIDYNTYIELSRKGLMKQYTLSLRVTLQFSAEDPRIEYIPSEITVNIPHDKLEDFMKSLKKI